MQTLVQNDTSYAVAPAVLIPSGASFIGIFHMRLCLAQVITSFSFLWNAISHPCHTSYGLAELLFKLWHWWVITAHTAVTFQQGFEPGFIVHSKVMSQRSNQFGQGVRPTSERPEGQLGWHIFINVLWNISRNSLSLIELSLCLLAKVAPDQHNEIED